jgi:hypothetical protein
MILLDLIRLRVIRVRSLLLACQDLCYLTKYKDLTPQARSETSPSSLKSSASSSAAARPPLSAKPHRKPPRRERPRRRRRRD